MAKHFAHVSELPDRLRHGRDEGFVTIEDAAIPTDEQKLAVMRDMIAEGDDDMTAARVSPVDEVFDRLYKKLRDQHGV